MYEHKLHTFLSSGAMATFRSPNQHRREGDGGRGVGGSDPLVFAHPIETENGVGSIGLAVAAHTHNHWSWSLVLA
jgi:hypothetical protein